jgi:hypothetical protein
LTVQRRITWGNHGTILVEGGCQWQQREQGCREHLGKQACSRTYGCPSQDLHFHPGLWSASEACREGACSDHLKAPIGRISNDVIVPSHRRQVQAYRGVRVRCAGTPVDECTVDARRDEPSLCPLPECVEDASLTRAPSREVVLVSCRKVPLASQAHKRSPRLRSLVAWLQRFFRRMAGDDRRRAPTVASSSASLLWSCGEHWNTTD